MSYTDFTFVESNESSQIEDDITLFLASYAISKEQAVAGSDLFVMIIV